MYAPPIQAFYYILRFSFTFFGVKWIPVHKHKILVLAFLSTSTFIMNDSEQGVRLRGGRTCTLPQYRHFATYYGFVFLFWGEMDTSSQTNTKSWF